MRFIYDKELDMWTYEGENGITIYITDWADTEKGPIVDFAIFIDSMDNDIIYEVEVMTKSLQDKKKAELCEEICMSYDDNKKDNFLSDILDKVDKVLGKCNVNVYLREIGSSKKVMAYGKKRTKFRTLRYTVRYDRVYAPLKGREKPALEYPGSRLDCIAD